MIVCYKVCSHIRTCTDYNAIVGNSRLHINNTSIRVTQIIDQCRFRLFGLNGNHISICLNTVNAKVTCCSFMIFNQRLQAFLYRLSITDTPIGKYNTIVQSNFPGQLIYIFIFFGNPWFNFHGIRIAEQGFADTIADAGPAGVGVLWINIRFFILRIKGGITKYKCFLIFRHCGHCSQTYCHTDSQCNSKNLLCFHLHSSSCLFILLYLTCFFPNLTYFISALTAQKSPKLCFGSRVFQPLTVSHHLIRLFFGSR